MDNLQHYYQRFSQAVHHPRMILRKLRQYQLRLTSPSLQTKLIEAYEHPDSPARSEMLKLARTYYGLDAGPTGALREATHFKQRLLFARETLYRKGLRYDLGAWGIGFRNIKIQCASNSVLESMIYLDGFYDELTVFKVYESCLRPNDYVVDVGANVGVHSLAISRLVGEKGQVFAYEPSAPMVRRMQKNLLLNAVHNIRIRQTALGDFDGRIPFNDATGIFNQGLGRHDPESEITVPVVRLDYELQAETHAISLIKIDVEGMELRVIRGACKILERDRPAIVVEFNTPPWSLKEFLAAIPYPTRIYRIPNTFHETMRTVENQSDLFGLNNLLVIPADSSGVAL